MLGKGVSSYSATVGTEQCSVPKHTTLQIQIPKSNFKQSKTEKEIWPFSLLKEEKAEVAVLFRAYDIK